MIDTPRVDCARARTLADFLQAFRCVYRSYLERGLMDAERVQSLRVTRHHLLPETCVFVARRGPSIVGTLTLIEDRRLGTPSRAVFPMEVEDLVRSAGRIAEVGCLAIDGRRVTCGAGISYRLMALAAQAAIARGISRLVVTVHPRHARYYERIASFRPFTGIVPHPGVAGAPAVGLALDLERWNEESPHTFQRCLSHRFAATDLSPDPTPPRLLKRLAVLWRSQQQDLEWSRPQIPAEVRKTIAILPPSARTRELVQSDELQRKCG